MTQFLQFLLSVPRIQRVLPIQGERHDEDPCTDDTSDTHLHGVCLWVIGSLLEATRLAVEELPGHETEQTVQQGDRPYDDAGDLLRLHSCVVGIRGFVALGESFCRTRVFLFAHDRSISREYTVKTFHLDQREG